MLFNKEIFSVIEAQKYLGVGRSTIYHLVNTPDFPTLRIGSRILIPREALEEWVRSNTKGGCA